MEVYTIKNIDLSNVSSEEAKIIRQKLDEYGLAIIENVIPDDKCDEYVKTSVDWLGKLIKPLSRAPETWTFENLPSGPRKGMMQSIISHSPVAWELREKLYPLFSALHGTKDLITSLDGATILPPIQGSNKDWPHIDQTKSEDDIKCFQGQVVLTNTTACFRCTPKSHLKHKEIVETLEINRKNQWYKFKDIDISTISPWFDEWQIPIQVSKGSIILWRSTTIHSAKYVDDPKIYKPLYSWDGWRCVYYICMRPKKQFTKTGLKTIKKAALEGRTTNHWGTKTFPKRQRYDDGKHRSVDKLLDDPTVVVQELNEVQKKLVDLI